MRRTKRVVMPVTGPVLHGRVGLDAGHAVVRVGAAVNVNIVVRPAANLVLVRRHVLLTNQVRIRRPVADLAHLDAAVLVNGSVGVFALRETVPVEILRGADGARLVGGVRPDIISVVARIIALAVTSPRCVLAVRDVLRLLQNRVKFR